MTYQTMGGNIDSESLRIAIHLLSFLKHIYFYILLSNGNWFKINFIFPTLCDKIILTG